MTISLSEDDGKTWKYSKCIDTREHISYPDADYYDGTVYLTYDRGRMSDREILFTSFRQKIVKHCSTGFRQLACLLTCHENSGKDIGQVLPWQLLIGYQMVKLFEHSLIIAILFTIYGEHTGSLADADGIDSGQLIVYIASQSGDVCNLGNVLLTV